MVESLHEFDFSAHTLLPLDFFHSVFVVDLQRHFLSRRLVNSKFHHCISTLTYLFANLVFFHSMFVRKLYYFFRRLPFNVGGQYLVLRSHHAIRSTNKFRFRLSERVFEILSSTLLSCSRSVFIIPWFNLISWRNLEDSLRLI